MSLRYWEMIENMVEKLRSIIIWCCYVPHQMTSMLTTFLLCNATPFQLCVGDVSVITELISEGLGGDLSLGTLSDAFDSAISLYGGLKNFKGTITNFSLFSRVLSKQLLSNGEKKTSKTLEAADRYYCMFMECDVDKSGGVSLEEYVVFCSKEGVPRSMAETMFFQADVDGNGESESRWHISGFRDLGNFIPFRTRSDLCTNFNIKNEIIIRLLTVNIWSR